MKNLNRLRAFVLPEGSASLKVVFDNVRNYGLCAGVFALAYWLSRDQQVWRLQGWLLEVLSYLALGTASFLLVANAVQTYFVLTDLFYDATDTPKEGVATVVEGVFAVLYGGLVAALLVAAGLLVYLTYLRGGANG